MVHSRGFGTSCTYLHISGGDFSSSENGMRRIYVYIYLIVSSRMRIFQVRRFKGRGEYEARPLAHVTYFRSGRLVCMYPLLVRVINQVIARRAGGFGGVGECDLHFIQSETGRTSTRTLRDIINPTALLLHMSEDI